MLKHHEIISPLISLKELTEYLKNLYYQNKKIIYYADVCIGKFTEKDKKNLLSEVKRSYVHINETIKYKLVSQTYIESIYNLIMSEDIKTYELKCLLLDKTVDYIQAYFFVTYSESNEFISNSSRSDYKRLKQQFKQPVGFNDEHEDAKLNYHKANFFLNYAHKYSENIGDKINAIENHRNNLLKDIETLRANRINKEKYETTKSSNDYIKGKEKYNTFKQKFYQQRHNYGNNFYNNINNSKEKNFSDSGVYLFYDELVELVKNEVISREKLTELEQLHRSNRQDKNVEAAGSIVTLRGLMNSKILLNNLVGHIGKVIKVMESTSWQLGPSYQVQKGKLNNLISAITQKIQEENLANELEKINQALQKHKRNKDGILTLHLKLNEHVLILLSIKEKIDSVIKNMKEIRSAEISDEIRNSYLDLLGFEEYTKFSNDNCKFFNGLKWYKEQIEPSRYIASEPRFIYEFSKNYINFLSPYFKNDSALLKSWIRLILQESNYHLPNKNWLLNNTVFQSVRDKLSLLNNDMTSFQVPARLDELNEALCKLLKSVSSLPQQQGFKDVHDVCKKININFAPIPVMFNNKIESSKNDGSIEQRLSGRLYSLRYSEESTNFAFEDYGDMVSSEAKIPKLLNTGSSEVIKCLKIFPQWRSVITINNICYNIMKYHHPKKPWQKIASASRTTINVTNSNSFLNAESLPSSPTKLKAKDLPSSLSQIITSYDTEMKNTQFDADKFLSMIKKKVTEVLRAVNSNIHSNTNTYLYLVAIQNIKSGQILKRNQDKVNWETYDFTDIHDVKWSKAPVPSRQVFINPAIRGMATNLNKNLSRSLPPSPNKFAKNRAPIPSRRQSSTDSNKKR